MAGKAISNVYVWGNYPNGRIPYDAMVRLDDIPGNWFANDSMYAHPESAARIRWIYAECQKRGLKSVRPNECYRDLATQQFWKTYWTNAGKPGNAATPGGSPHGFGYACDWDFSPADEAGFYEVCAEAGMLFNISGEDWHNAPLANATVDLDGATRTAPTISPKGKTMRLLNVTGYQGKPAAKILIEEGKSDRVVDDGVANVIGVYITDQDTTQLKSVPFDQYEAVRIARGA